MFRGISQETRRATIRYSSTIGLYPRLACCPRLGMCPVLQGIAHVCPATSSTVCVLSCWGSGGITGGRGFLEGVCGRLGTGVVVRPRAINLVLIDALLRFWPNHGGSRVSVSGGRGGYEHVAGSPFKCPHKVSTAPWFGVCVFIYIYIVIYM